MNKDSVICRYCGKTIWYDQASIVAGYLVCPYCDEAQKAPRVTTPSQDKPIYITANLVYPRLECE